MATRLHFAQIIGVLSRTLFALSFRIVNTIEVVNALSKCRSTASASTKNKGDVNETTCTRFVMHGESKSEDIMCRWSGSNDGIA